MRCKTSHAASNYCCLCYTHCIGVGLCNQISKEQACITEASAANDILICDEAVAPVEPKLVLAGACTAEDTSNNAVDMAQCVAASSKFV